MLAELDLGYTALYEDIVNESWQPPISWDALDLDRDRRSWIDALVSYDLLPKASSAVTCRAFFRKILEYSTHWTRAGMTTCHLFTCRNCGTGKMRAHRMYAADPQRYEHISNSLTRTIRLTVHHSAPTATLADYVTRVLTDRRLIRPLWRKMRAKFHDAGFILSIDLDKRCKDVSFRLFYVGEDPHHQWIRSQWQRIAGLEAYSESKQTWDSGKDALRWTLDSLTDILMLPGTDRAGWEKEFEGVRLTACVGTLRGAKLDAEIELLPESDDPEAPYGRCPCGCNGIVVKSDHHEPLTIAQLQSSYVRVDFGPLRDYTAYRSKVDGSIRSEYRILPIAPAQSPSPPS